MSRDGGYTGDFGGEERHFRLGYNELIELQECLDAGPWYLLAQFMGLRQMLLNPTPVRGLGVKVPREIIRIGLIGGGMKPPEALRLVRAYVEARPPDEYAGLAFEILHAGVSGAEDADEVKKKDQEEESKSTPSPEEKSGSQP